MTEQNRFSPPKAVLADTGDLKNRSANRSWLSRYWSGRVPLWKAFWPVGVLSQIAAPIGAGLISGFVLRHPVGSLLSFAISAVIVVAVAVFASVSVWRSAFNTKHPQFGALARVAVGFYLGAWLLYIYKLDFVGAGG